MSNPAAILSAGTSLSALLGGGAAAGGASSAAGTKGDNSADFKTFLPHQDPSDAPAKQASRAVSSSNTASDTHPSQDSTPAPTGKNLPLAALTAAVLPLPITLTALTKPTDQQDAPATTATQDDGANISLDPTLTSDTNALAQSATLAMMAQTTAAPAQTGAPSTSATPGFSLLDAQGDGTTMPSIEPATLAATSAKDPSAVTLQAETAMAMANPSAIASLNAHPGFSLTIETPPASMPATTNPTSPAAAQAVLASADGGTAAPGFATIQLASADTGKGLSPRLAASRKPNASDAKSTDRVGAANASDNDQPGFTTFRSPTTTAANNGNGTTGGANHDALLASSGGATQPAMPASDGAPANPAALIGATLAVSAPQAQAQPMLAANTGTSPTNDMSALVDRLVEARAAARSGLGAQTTLASVTHTDFGRVSLRFDSDESGMSISMSSKDPGFAPAAQAALAQQPGVAASAQGNAAGQQGSSQHNASQPGQQWASASHAPGTGSTGSGSAGGHSTGTGGQNGNQGGQNQGPSAQGFAPVSLASATSKGSSTDTSAPRRGGILA